MSDVAGWLVLGTKLETKQLEKNLKDEEKKLEQFGKKIEKLTSKSIKINAEIELKGKEFEQKIKEIEQKRDIKIAANTTGRMVDRRARDEKYRAEAQLQINKLQEEYNSYLDEADKTLGDIEQQITKTTTQQELTKNNIKNITNELSKKNNLNQIKNSATSIKNETEGILKKVVRWGLAIFSIRSAYLMIRRAVSTLSQYNEKLASDLEYIQFALASALQPLIERIIQLVYKLLAYIGYIAKAWFNVDLFANASAKSFAKAKKQLAGTNKEAKELQKTLAGFDEMNVLQDGNTRTGGGGGGITLPSTDLGNLDDIEIPGWLEWIKDYGPFVVSTLLAIGSAIAGFKFAQFVAGAMGMTEGLTQIGAGIGSLLGGFTLLVGSIVVLITQWDNLTLSQKELGVHLAGLGGAFVALGLVLTGLVSGPVGLLIGGIALLASGIAGLIIKNNEDAKSTLSAAEASKQLKDAKDKLRESTNRYTSALDNSKKTQDELNKLQKKYKISGDELFASVLAGTKTVDNMTDAELKVYKAYLNNESAQKELAEANKEMNEYRKESIEKAEQEAAAIYKETGKYNEYFKAVIEGYNNKTKSESEMLSVTAKIYNKLDEETRKTFAQNLPDNIKKAIDSNANLVEVFDDGVEQPLREISNASKKTFAQDIPNDVDKAIKKTQQYTKEIEKAKKAANYTTTMTVKSTTSSGKVPNAKGAIYYPPKLAVGGIINQPGRGIPLGSAIGGERGAEGVIPLTDSQAMAQLGYEIGRNVTINTTLNNYMNARLMNRELLRTQNEEDFAFNG